MSQKFADILKVFSKFLNDGIIKKGKIKTIQEVLELPIHSYKFLDKNEAKMVGEILEVKNIGEAAKLNKENPFETIIKTSKKDDELKKELVKKVELLNEKFPDFEKHLKKAITISSIITSFSIAHVTNSFKINLCFQLDIFVQEISCLHGL